MRTELAYIMQRLQSYHGVCATGSYLLTSISRSPWRCNASAKPTSQTYICTKVNFPQTLPGSSGEWRPAVHMSPPSGSFQSCVSWLHACRPPLHNSACILLVFTRDCLSRHSNEQWRSSKAVFGTPFHEMLEHSPM